MKEPGKFVMRDADGHMIAVMLPKTLRDQRDAVYETFCRAAVRESGWEPTRSAMLRAMFAWAIQHHPYTKGLFDDPPA